MRGKVFLLTVIISTFILIAILRNHIRDLADIARTYTTFRAQLSTPPTILFRYPANEQSDDNHADGLTEPIPKILHQIFLTHNQPNASLERYQPAIDSCRALHPQWTYRLWSDDAATDFIAAHYPDILPHYTSYHQNIQRANILRYALLHHFGGVYLDLDITCRVALDAPIPSSSPASSSGVRSLTHLPWLTPAAYPAGVNNAFILARPAHPFLTYLLHHVPSRDLAWGLPYVENMLSTGCMFFSNMWTAYTRRLAATWRSHDPGVAIPAADRVYVLADAEGMVEPHMLRGRVTTPLFVHGGASSWHGWDAAAIVLVGAHYRWFAALAGLSMGMTVVLVWRMWGSRGSGQRRRSRRSVAACFGLERKSREAYNDDDDEDDQQRRLMGEDEV